MTNYTFPCASVNGLTTNQKRAAIAALRASLIADRANAKASKIATAEAKAAARREREATAIAKAQLKLQKLLDKQTGLVGVKALKANRKSGKVTTTGAEDNAIAAALVAKRVQPELF
jgi:hypothetical protein